jgi:hypothetical protein
MKQTKVTAFHLPWSTDHHKIREDWFIDRVQHISFDCEEKGEAAAELAFHLSNAPEECLEEDQKRLLKRLEFKGPSLSVGDIVRVAPYLQNSNSKLPVYYLCKSVGWEKFKGDTIQLLKHLQD